MSDEIKNIFGDGFEPSKAGSFVKWEKPGQHVKGILIDIYEKENTLAPGNPIQKVYVFEDDNGDQYQVSSRGKIFDAQMKKIVFGQWVGLLYEKDKPSDKKGYSAAKIITVWPGQVDKEWRERNSQTVEVSNDDELNKALTQ